MNEHAGTAEKDAPPEWCPRSACMYPECLLLVDECASALMASGPRQEFPDVEPRRPRRVTSPGSGHTHSEEGQ